MTKPLEVFAERHLYLRSDQETRKVLVQFGPVIKDNVAASCRYSLSGFGEPITREIWGFDEVQALQLAMASAGSELDRLAGGSKYSVDEDSDGEMGHGLPTLI